MFNQESTLKKETSKSPNLDQTTSLSDSQHKKIKYKNKKENLPNKKNLLFQLITE